MRVAILILLLPVTVLADVNNCYNQMTHEPFCVSKVNADVFCASIGVNQDIFINAKKCIIDAKSSGMNAQEASKFCTRTSIVSMNPVKNASNCGMTVSSL